MAGNADAVARTMREASDLVYNMINLDKPVVVTPGASRCRLVFGDDGSDNERLGNIERRRRGRLGG